METMKPELLQLQILRQEIDSLDNQLLSILEKRFEVCRRIRLHKLSNGINRVDSEREEEIMEKLIHSSKNFEPEQIVEMIKPIQNVFRKIVANGEI